LHVQRNPELVGDKGHISEENGEYAESIVSVLPNAGIEKWAFIDVFPECEAEKKGDSKDYRYNHYSRIPTSNRSFSKSLLAMLM
jgi:hypothetical protein